MRIPHEIAKSYLNSGLSVLPARRKDKFPAVKSWKAYQHRLPTAAEVNAWFANGHDAVCIVTGKASGNLEIIDFDNGGELFDRWAAMVEDRHPGLMDRLVIENTPSGGWHVIYRCGIEVSGNLKLAQGQRNGKLTTLIETRGDGGLFLCVPTPGYELLQGDFAGIPTLTEAERETLLQTAWELNEHWQSVNPPSPAATPTTGIRPGDDYNERGDIKSLLETHGWKHIHTANGNEYFRRPGKTNGSWSASLKDRVFYVFSSNAAPFEPSRAYSPFSVYATLEHNSDFAEAAKALLTRNYGESVTPVPVDISGITGSFTKSSRIADPGPLPEELLYVPGFISNVMDYTLKTAPYPNKVLAFAGALTLQSYLAGRKIRDNADNRTNLYLIALANSGSGKDHPRKVNTNIAYEVGLCRGLGDAFASGEGIEDSMFANQAMLFQTDEIDGLINSINKARDARYESLMNVLLKMHSAANSIYPLRKKAGQTEPLFIVNPSLTLFGTAVPQYYYEALSSRMLNNGFFARLLVFEADMRGEGQEPLCLPIPPEIIETALFWARFTPGSPARQNLVQFNPEPLVFVPDSRAAERYREVRTFADTEYRNAEKNNDIAGMAVWARAYEKARKLALNYAASVNYKEPEITLDAVDWAWRIADHQTRRMLFMAQSRVAENPFHAECLKLKEKLRGAPGMQMPHSLLLKRMKMRTREFDEVVTALLVQGDIEVIQNVNLGRHGKNYRLTE